MLFDNEQKPPNTASLAESLENSLPILIPLGDIRGSQSSLEVNVSQGSLRSSSGSWTSIQQPAGDIRGSQSSLEVNLSHGSMSSNSGSWTRAPASLRDSQTMRGGAGWQSEPATPPPEPGSPPHSQLIGGTGRLFPSTLPSSALSLSVSSQSGGDTGSIPRGVLDVSDSRDSLRSLEEDLLSTRLEGSSLESPIQTGRTGSLKERIFLSVLPTTPSLTPNRKRGLSPSSTPSPAKRLKVDLARDSEEDSSAKEERQGRTTEQAFHSARKLTLDLIESTGCSVKEPEAGGGIASQGNSQGNTPRHTLPCSPRICPVDGPSEGRSLVSSAAGQAERCDSTPRYTTMVEVEYFSDDEIERYLGGHLSAYRAFYLEPDEEEPPRPRDADTARASWRILKAIFGDRLDAAEDDEFLLGEDKEEDILDWLVIWACEQRSSSGLGQGVIEGLSGWLEQLEQLATTAFVKRVILSVEIQNGSLFTVHLPARNLDDGTAAWDLDEVREMFAEIEELDLDNA